MFKEYSVVLAKKDLENVPKGSRGTVLIIYEEGNAFEVEFVTEQNETIAILTVAGDDIELE